MLYNFFKVIILLFSFILFSCNSSDDTNEANLEVKLHNTSWTEDDTMSVIDMESNKTEIVNLDKGCRTSYDFFINEGIENLTDKITFFPQIKCSIETNKITYFIYKNELVIRAGQHRQTVYNIDTISDTKLILIKYLSNTKYIKLSFTRKASKN